MSSPGHVPVNNFRGTFEASVLAASIETQPAVTNLLSLPYYQPPDASTVGLQPGKEVRSEGTILEGGIMEQVSVEPSSAIPDVAVASFGQKDVLELVFGNDDRVKVAKEYMSANPWRQICALRIKSSSGAQYIGTGWFIGPKLLATAGHCVYLQQDGGWAASIEVFPAKYGQNCFARMEAWRFASVDGWTVKQEREFDYGVIFLEDGAPGEKLGNFEVRVLEDHQLNGVKAKISGYPADREQGQYQYFHERPLQSVTSGRLNYKIDTYGGQSGSPIWQETKEHGFVAVGIHTTGGATSNSGTRINNDVLNNLIAWLEL